MANTPLYIPVLEERKKFKDYRYDVWGDSFNWYRLRAWETIRYIVFHHSVTNPTKEAKSDVDYIAEIHRRNGWGGIGYHFVITADGVVWYVGDISTQRANVADKNHLVIGICLVGDFTKSNPTDEQILSAHDLAKYLITDVGALINVKKEGWKAVVGHKELQATQCPGIYWKGVPDSIYERVKNRIPYTRQPQPEPEIDWKKHYEELKNQCETSKKEVVKEAKDQEKEECRVKLAEQEEECQQKIKRLGQNLENLKSDNPKIPTIKDFPDKEVFSDTARRIGKYLKNKIRREN